MILIGLLFLTTNIFLSNLLIFSVDNYNTFIDSSKKLDLYLDLDRKFFQSKEFLYQFKSFDNNFNYYNNYIKNIWNFNSKNSNSHTEKFYNSLFNSNYSTSAYLNHLTHVYSTEEDPKAYLQKNKIKFHWGDWVDLSPALPFVNAYNDILNSNHFKGDERKLQTMIHERCYNELFDVQKPWLDKKIHDEQASVFEQLQDIGICSAIFKYYYWPIPERVLFESDITYFDVPTHPKRLKSPLGLKGLSKVYNELEQPKSTGVKNFIEGSRNRDQQMDNLLQVYKDKGFPSEEISLQEQISQDPNDFNREDFEGLLKKYRSIEKPTAKETKYLNFLEFSKENVEKATRFYFTFPLIRADSTAELHHYTFPWIKQVISHEERLNVVHHLIRSWFKFAENAGIISWFSYGNLIGWYFNSSNLPWDNDVDVQLSIKDMDKLGRDYNNSLIVEDPKLGESLFWFQTNPFYLQQNNAQFIDARYIDTKSGIYIDISALWRQDGTPPQNLHLEKDEIAFHCKHYNWFGYNQIFPIKRTLYEGAQAYMVNDVVSTLIKQFGTHPLTQTNENHHNWQEDLGLWVPNNVCEKERVPPTEDRFDDDGNLTLFGACNNTELLELYNNFKPAWNLHKKEAELIKKGESTAELTKKSLPIFRRFPHDEYR